MKTLFRWIISNTPAMNIIMIVVLGVGTFAAMSLQRDNMPEFNANIITIFKIINISTIKSKGKIFNFYFIHKKRYIC